VRSDGATKDELNEWRQRLEWSEQRHAASTDSARLASCLAHMALLKAAPMPCGECEKSGECKRAFELNNLGTAEGVDCLGA